MLKQVNGWLWPASDTECQKVAFDFTSLHAAILHCDKFNVAIQAGGNVGVWPKRLASAFKAVYTAEPDPDNFACLVANVPETNVVKFQCAFGRSNHPMGMTRSLNNCGAGYMEGAGVLPIIEVDYIGVPDCNLLCLDVEGMELQALKSARHTVSAWRPVILLEQKGHEARYGDTADDIAAWMETHDYRVHSKIHRDVIWVPK